MFFYELTPARQGSYCRYASNATAFGATITYHITVLPVFSPAVLHAKIDRVLELLLSEPQTELEGTMSTQQAADFLAISKRTFERKVKAGLISPVTKNRHMNRFSKQDIVQLYIAYRGCKPPFNP